MAARAKRGRDGGAKRKRRPNWSQARKQFEIEGRSFTEIGKLQGCTRETVSRHAQAEGWIKRAEIERASRADRAEEIRRRFILQDAEAIAASLATKHEVTQLLLDTTKNGVLGIVSDMQDAEVKRQAKLMERRAATALHDGTAPASEDEDDPKRYFPTLALRRAALIIQAIEGVDSRLADLKAGGGGWRSSTGQGSTASDDIEEAVSRALREAGD